MTFRKDSHFLPVQIHIPRFAETQRNSLLMMYSANPNSLVLARGGEREEVVLNSSDMWRFCMSEKLRVFSSDKILTV